MGMSASAPFRQQPSWVHLKLNPIWVLVWKTSPPWVLERIPSSQTPSGCALPSELNCFPQESLVNSDRPQALLLLLSVHQLEQPLRHLVPAAIVNLLSFLSSQQNCTYNDLGHDSVVLSLYIHLSLVCFDL